MLINPFRYGENLITATDSYKVPQWRQIRTGTELSFAALGTRSTKLGIPYAMVGGLQGILMEYFQGQRIDPYRIKHAEAYFEKQMPGVKFNRRGWEIIADEFGGKLPLCIRALPEGSIVPIGMPVMTVYPTDPRFIWLMTYPEPLLMHVWMTMNVATISHYIKHILREAMIETGSHLSKLPYMLNDFGLRGAGSPQAAARGGLGELFNFRGTDNNLAVEYAMDMYESDVCGESIQAATEHSTTCQYNSEEEFEFYREYLADNPNGLIACVIDAYNQYNVAEMFFGGEARDQILARDGTVVLRPDCYAEGTEIMTEEGFVDFAVLEHRPELKVAQYNHDGTIDFVLPHRYIKQQYTGEMHHFTDEKGRLDICVTPNHNMVLQTSRGVNHRRAAEYMPNSLGWKYNFLRSGVKNGSIDTLTALERIAIAFQADGSYESRLDVDAARSDNSPVKIRFNFTKQRKTERLIRLCNEAGVIFSTHHELARSENCTIYVHYPTFVEKTFSWVDLRNVSGKWCQEFIEELSYWDATRRTDNRFKYDTTVPANADIVQTITSLAGYGCTYGVHPDDRKDQFSDIHTLSILKHNNRIGGQGIQHHRIQYTGFVYCVTVDTGMIVVRRNRKTLVCGNSGHPPYVVVKLLHILAAKFGTESTSKGFKLLPAQIRLLQGDGVSKDSIPEILAAMMEAGFAIENIAFGSGGALLQTHNRDSLGMAMKKIADYRNGTWHDVFKDPIDDAGKKSWRGLQKIVRDGIHYKAVPCASIAEVEAEDNCMREVFRNGDLFNLENLDTVRARADSEPYLHFLEGK